MTDDRLVAILNNGDGNPPTLFHAKEFELPKDLPNHITSFILECGIPMKHLDLNPLHYMWRERAILRTGLVATAIMRHYIYLLRNKLPRTDNRRQVIEHRAEFLVCLEILKTKQIEIPEPPLRGWFPDQHGSDQPFIDLHINIMKALEFPN